MSKPIQSVLVPIGGNDNLFLVLEDNHYKWFKSDPLLDPASSEINLEDYLVNAFEDAEPSRINPIVMKARIGYLDRGTPFDVSLPNKIRQKQMNSHFVDYEGHVVEILEGRNGSSGFPFNGVVMDAMGNMLGMRRYSTTGECDDNDEAHSIFAIDGPASFDNSAEDE